MFFSLEKVALFAQLAETEKYVIKDRNRDVNLNSLKRNIPLVTFLNDDGNPAILKK